MSDIFATAQINELWKTRSDFEGMKDNGGVGSVANHHVICPLPCQGEPDGVFTGMNFHHISDLTPTKEEFDNGNVYIIVVGSDGVEVRINLHIDQDVNYNYDVVYGGQLMGELWGRDAPINAFIMITYDVGTYTVDVGGYGVSVDIPKTGIYVSWDDGETELHIEYEEVKKINPKFLPETVVFDLDAMGITPALLNGMASGSTLFGTTALRDETFWNKIPTNTSFACKFSMPGMGAYEITPALQLRDETGQLTSVTLQLMMTMEGTFNLVYIAFGRMDENSTEVQFVMKSIT